MSIPTPHISSRSGEIAKTVLMPGDPLRSRFIAQNYLEDPVLVNDTRAVQGYTGKWRGIPVTVMASGMGIPSIGIYSYELYNFYDVENIIRVGSAGAISQKLKLMDIVAAIASSTDSNFAHQYGLPGTFAPAADYHLLKTAVETARQKGTKMVVGNLLSTDNFYSDGSDDTMIWAKMGVLAVEMESAGLYMSAARAAKRALCLCTISDHIVTGESLPAKERQLSLTQMIEIALDTAASL